MSRQPLALVVLLVTALACRGTEPNPDVGPDPVIGTYELKGGAGISATCSATLTIVDAVVFIEADHTWNRAYSTTTPGGSHICGFIGGTWARVNGTTLELTPDQDAFRGFPPRQVTVVGDELKFTDDQNTVYLRRSEP